MFSTSRSFRFFVCRLSVIVLSLTAFTSNGQSLKKVPPINLPDYKASFWSRIVVFENGYAPFSENGKWGMTDLSDSVVLPAIYDSLLPGRFNQCIAVRNGEYQLLDVDFRPCFKEQMQRIVYESYKYVVTDKKGRVSTYTTNKEPFDLVSLSTNPVNHLISYPPGEPKATKYTQFIYEMDFDKLQVVPIEKTGGSRYTFYAEEKALGTFEFKKEEEIQFVGSHFLRVTDQSTNHQRIIDVKTSDTILSQKLSGCSITYFEDNEVPYFQMETLSAKDTTTSFFDGLGRLIFNGKGCYMRTPGCLIEQFNRNYYVGNVYSFPELKSIAQNVNYLYAYDNYLAMNPVGTSTCTIYDRGKEIYSMEGDANLRFGYPRHPKVSPLVVIHYGDREHPSTRIITNEGKVIVQADEYVSVLYDEGIQELIIYFNTQKVFGVYDEANQSFHLSKLNPENFTPIASNVVVYYDHDLYDSNEKSLMNLDGEHLLSKPLIGLYWFSVKEKTFIMSYATDSVLRVYDEHMVVVCEDCYVMELDGVHRVLFEDRDFFVRTKSPNPGYGLEVLDHNLERVLPDTYLAVTFSAEGDYFVVLHQNMEQEYIRFSSTEYAKKHRGK